MVTLIRYNNAKLTGQGHSGKQDGSAPASASSHFARIFSIGKATTKGGRSILAKSPEHAASSPLSAAYIHGFRETRPLLKPATAVISPSPQQIQPQMSRKPFVPSIITLCPIQKSFSPLSIIPLLPRSHKMRILSPTPGLLSLSLPNRLRLSSSGPGVRASTSPN